MSGKPVPPLPTPYPPAIPSMGSGFAPATTQSLSLPSLLQHLVAEYREYIRRANETRARQEQKLLDPEATLRAAKPLLDFFESYLNTYRPVQAFPVDANYGLLLSNGMRCMVSPGVVDVRGTMQDSGAIQVSQGISNPGQEGVIPVRGLDL